MTTKIHLVRHGHTAALGRVLCGRMPGVELDAQGCSEMQAAACWIASLAPVAIQSSPQRRTLQSAAIVAAACSLPVEIVAALDEIEMGVWTGRRFDELELDPRWRAWNRRRGSTRPPGGESMAQLQARLVDHIGRLAEIYVDEAVVVISHAEPIRAALMHFLGVPLQQFHRVEIDPASISTISFENCRASVPRVNARATA